MLLKKLLASVSVDSNSTKDFLKSSERSLLLDRAFNSIEAIACVRSSFKWDGRSFRDASVFRS